MEKRIMGDGVESGKSDKDEIRNKISIAKPQFSISLETDESLDKAKKVFDELMEKYKK